mmetsp:Transcript_113304/g.366142  ORF Transcript_113304/g.366142 Transcript_113304/m.366142 type:complete len:238 (+) Transcript_113304:1287-2000(+)
MSSSRMADVAASLASSCAESCCVWADRSSKRDSTLLPWPDRSCKRDSTALRSSRTRPAASSPLALRCRASEMRPASSAACSLTRARSWLLACSCSRRSCRFAEASSPSEMRCTASVSCPARPPSPAALLSCRHSKSPWSCSTRSSRAGRDSSSCFSNAALFSSAPASRCSASATRPSRPSPLSLACRRSSCSFCICCMRFSTDFIASKPLDTCLSTSRVRSASPPPPSDALLRASSA